jgi:hypothetical protein
MKHSDFTVLTPILNSDHVIMLRTSAGANGNSRALVSQFLANLLALVGTDDIAWTAVDKTGSDLADLVTKSHTDLTDIGTNTHAQIDSFMAANDLSKIVNLAPFPSDIDVEIRDGTIAFTVPVIMNGLNLTAALASVYVPGVGTGATNIQIRRSRSGVEANMLSTVISLSAAEYFVSDGVIDTSYDDIITGDQIFIDVEQLTATSPPQGLSVVLTFS